MMQPRQVTPIDESTRRKIAAHLVTNYCSEGAPTIRQLLAFIPSEVNAWKKIKLLHRDEVIRTVALIGDGEKHHRDNTFVKVSVARHFRSSFIYIYDTQYIQEVDINAHKRNAPVVLRKQDFYGQVLQFVAFGLPSTCPYQQTPRTHVLAIIAPIKLEKEVNRVGMRFYKGDKLRSARIVDISCILCVVGRVEDRGLWTLIERGEMGQLLESPEGDHAS
jgi:hypothetical protein